MNDMPPPPNSEFVVTDTQNKSNDNEKVELTLYYFKQCPFCQKVLAALDSMNKTLPMKNVRENQSFKQELLDIAGKTQVPCLVINGVAMHESMDIIEWLKEHEDLLD